MRHRLVSVYIVIVTLPLAVFGWLGARSIAYERGLLEQQVGKLVEEQLTEWNATVADAAQEMARSVESTAWDVADHDSLRRQIQKDGRVRQFFILGVDGQFAYPPIQAAMTQAERGFIERTRTVWESGAISPQTITSSNQYSNTSKLINVSNSIQSFGASELRGQWHPWYWGNGLHLIYWWPTDSGEIYGVEWDRSRLIADLIGILPDTSLQAEEETLGVQWIGATGQVLYQWGVVPEQDDDRLVTSQVLAAPFGAWSFKAYMNIYAPSQPLRMWFIGTGLSVVMLIFVSLGLYFYRENARELREAEQRVSFVNHVSHELKTPLTNIRLYAELLKDDADDTAGPAGKRLSVILSESERLSRLINNVLAFNRNRASKLTLSPMLGSVDDTLRHVIDQFRPLLAQHGIDLRFTGDAPDKCSFDADVLEQIVGNLLSNVEKYARNASNVTVTSRIEGDAVEVVVHDDGDGIPEREREAIFEPFYRIDDSPSEGVAGTGIGLSIARDLAQLHGGELTLEPAETGARFRVCLQVQPRGAE